MNTHATDVILHAFDWPYEMVEQRAEQIHQAGYKYVLVSPPMKSLKRETGTQWWQRYQPQDYRVIDNQLGNTETFKSMLEALSSFGVGVYADVVFNHMANESSLRSDLVYPNASDLLAYQKQFEYYQKQRLFGDLSQPLFDHENFVEAFGIEDWEDRWQVQNGRITGGPSDPGLPTLRVCDHVVEQQQAYLKALKALGVKGFRIDAAKHMTLEHLKRVWSEEICQGIHIFGEIITSGGATQPEYELFLQPYLAETRLGAYDFPLFQTLYDALQGEGSLKALVDPYCFGQALSESRAITFTITHDIPNNDVFANLVMSETQEWLGYCYLLGRDGGVPLIYTDLDTSGITNQNKQPRWRDAWKDKKLLAAIEFHNRMHGSAMKIVEASDDLLVFSRGNEGMVIINKSKRSQTVEFKANCEWVDLLTNTNLLPSKGQCLTVVDPNTAMMLVSG
ncbi:alpha-amylase [Vibrio galatheae]|uniref:Alpha-amylase n=1 Tax=Vibrio galatheae TaxID=579748 RepID=A0A0F4NP26_9VIBR|nr:alpha-amylase family protein [Vibrio galatheae]KJY84583.1 alpha-amylase [Vibrio galatheae]